MIADAAVYDGTVRHRRHAFAERQFTARLFFAYLDLDALPGSLDHLPLWSARRTAPIHFRSCDYFDGRDAPLAPAVRELVHDRLGRRPEGAVTMLAHLRTFGWLFNPLSVYYCWQREVDALDAIVLEVTNTPWHERCWYVFDARDGVTDACAPKAMHVSPFLPTDLEYSVSWTKPARELALRIDVIQGNEQVFDAELLLQRVPLDRRHAVTLLARHPLVPTRVSAGIYAQALRLFAMGTPTFRHPSRRQRQARP